MLGCVISINVVGMKQNIRHNNQMTQNVMYILQRIHIN